MINFDVNTPASVLNSVGSPYKLKHSEPRGETLSERKMKEDLAGAGGKKSK